MLHPYVLVDKVLKYRVDCGPSLLHLLLLYVRLSGHFLHPCDDQIREYLRHPSLYESARDGHIVQPVLAQVTINEFVDEVDEVLELVRQLGLRGFRVIEGRETGEGSLLLG